MMFAMRRQVSSLARQKWVREAKKYEQRRRQREREAFGGKDIVLPPTVNPRVLSGLLGVRTVDILKSMISMGIDVQSSSAQMEADVVDIICHELAYIPVRLVSTGEFDVPSRRRRFEALLHAAKKKQYSRDSGLSRREVDAFEERFEMWKMCDDVERKTLLAKAKKRAEKALKKQSARQRRGGNDDGAEQVDVDVELLRPRSPVVAVLGHVNHGKTTLLDRLHGSSNVAETEVGRITQHVRAFQVRAPDALGGGAITVLDTPGHAAFSSIRKRGAECTDIALLLVAIDSGVQPQTIESIEYIAEHDLPTIVVLTKCDRDASDKDMLAIARDLRAHGVETDQVGGRVPSVRVSALHGDGIDELLELIAMQSDDLNLFAELDVPAEATVVDARARSRGGLGIEATALVRWGTLRVGDAVVCGNVGAKVRMLFSATSGGAIEEAPAGMPVRVVGFKEMPMPGDDMMAVANEKRARVVVEHRIKIEAREGSVVFSEVAPLDDPSREIGHERRLLQKHEDEIGDADDGAADDDDNDDDNDDASLKRIEFDVVLKTDVQSSFEAVQLAVDAEMSNDEELSIRFVHSGAGPISGNDIEVAAAAGGAIYGFSVTVPSRVRAFADRHGVRVQTFDVIYTLLDALREDAEARLTPLRNTVVLGEASVLRIFDVDVKRVGQAQIAGCRVGKGAMSRRAVGRVLRNGKTVAEAPFVSMKLFKDDVDTVRKGMECGLRIEEFDDYHVGDTIQAVRFDEEKRKFGQSRL
jgi:translation initiation factor IF-2